jgi:Lon protease-like protein
MYRHTQSSATLVKVKADSCVFLLLLRSDYHTDKNLCTLWREPERALPTSVYRKVSGLSPQRNKQQQQIKTRWEATQKVMAVKLIRLTQNSDTTAPSGRELYHLQFSLQAASPETFGYAPYPNSFCDPI